MKITEAARKYAAIEKGAEVSAQKLDEPTPREHETA